MLRAMRSLVAARAVALAIAVAACLAGAACSHPPPPPPPPAQQPVTRLADLAGQWVANDQLDWFYKLTIGRDGDLVLAVDRDKMGRCELHAHALRDARPPSFELEVSLDECHRDRTAGTIELRVPSYDGHHAVIELVAGGQTERHAFTRLVE